MKAAKHFEESGIDYFMFLIPVLMWIVVILEMWMSS